MNKTFTPPARHYFPFSELHSPNWEKTLFIYKKKQKKKHHYWKALPVVTQQRVLNTTTTPTLSPGVEAKWPPGDSSCTVERWQEPTHLASAAPDNEQPHAAKHTNVGRSGKGRILEKQSGIDETEEADYSGSKNQRGSSGADCWHLSCWKTPELIVRQGGKTGLV